MGGYCRIATTAEKKSKKRAPRGHVVVYVGDEEEMTRHVVPIHWLKNPEFQRLLDEAADVYGFQGHEGRRILLPCNQHTFNSIVCKP